MTPRRWFHVLLGAVFIPLLTLPLVWGVAIYWLRRAADAESRRWAKGLLALAVIDTLVVVTGGVLLAQEAGLEEPAAAADIDRVVIGVMPDLSFGGPGARLERIFPGGPAAAAGLEPGDVLTRVAGKDIPDHEALRSRIGELEPGVPVSVDLNRGPSTIALPITPQRASEIPRPQPALLEPVESELPCFPGPKSEGLLQLAFVFAATVVLAALVTRRGSGRGAARAVWWWGLALAAASVGSYAVPAGACALLGGHSMAGMVFAPWGSSLALAATALVAWRAMGDARSSAPARSSGSAVALGAWYILAGAARVAVLVAAVAELAPVEAVGAHPLEPLAREFAAVGGPGLLLLTVPAVLFAPVGEELAFRGLLQPALGAWLKPAAAVGLTALLFAAMHPFYGLKLPFVVLIGAVLGWARVVTRGLRAPIALHMLVNAVSSAAIFLGGAGP